MSCHAGSTTFFSQNTSDITPYMFPKSIPNDSTIEPKAVPQWSPRHLKRKAAKPSNSRQKGSQNNPKKDPEITNNGLGGLSTSKNR